MWISSDSGFTYNDLIIISIRTRFLSNESQLCLYCNYALASLKIVFSSTNLQFFCIVRSISFFLSLHSLAHSLSLSLSFSDDATGASRWKINFVLKVPRLVICNHVISVYTYTLKKSVELHVPRVTSLRVTCI